MKQLKTLLTAGGIIWVTAGQAQTVPPAAVPFRKANAVWVYAPQPADSLAQLIMRNLAQRGFAVQRPARGSWPVVTQPGIEAGGQGWPLVIRADTVNGGVRLTGRYRMPELPGHPEFVAEFLGFEWSPAKSSFRQLEKTAAAVPAGVVRYSRE